MPRPVSPPFFLIIHYINSHFVQEAKAIFAELKEQREHMHDRSKTGFEGKP